MQGAAFMNISQSKIYIFMHIVQWQFTVCTYIA